MVTNPRWCVCIASIRQLINCNLIRCAYKSIDINSVTYNSFTINLFNLIDEVINAVVTIAESIINLIFRTIILRILLSLTFGNYSKIDWYYLTKGLTR